MCTLFLPEFLASLPLAYICYMLQYCEFTYRSLLLLNIFNVFSLMDYMDKIRKVSIKYSLFEEISTLLIPDFILETRIWLVRIQSCAVRPYICVWDFMHF